MTEDNGESMKKILVIICISALVINAYFAYFENYRPKENDETQNDHVDVPTENQFKLKEEKSVTIGDITHEITVLSIDGNSVPFWVGGPGFRLRM